ncbi:MAG: hypothetical protein CM1200mP29_03960 [Verrucomicrobiota bacterium]|nr:MAG: hypothetical protein CM1200mP29_03960 [Verrucomicrobiota bacterium]
MLDAAANKFKPLSRPRPFGDGKVDSMSHPAIVGNRLYLRGPNELACFSLSGINQPSDSSIRGRGRRSSGPRFLPGDRFIQVNHRSDGVGQLVLAALGFFQPGRVLEYDRAEDVNAGLYHIGSPSFSQPSARSWSSCSVLGFSRFSGGKTGRRKN